MNYHLANYLFANETLYVTPDSPAAAISPQLSPIKPESEISKKNTTELPKPQENLGKEPATKVASVNLPQLQLNHKVLILLNQPTEAEKEFLGKVLGAIGLSLEKIDLIDLKTTQQLDYQVFVNQNITKKFISFGVTLTKLGWNKMLPPYQTKTFDNVDFLLTDELSKIEANVNLKKSLWANLQKLFPK